MLWIISFQPRDSWLHEQHEEDNQQSYTHTETCPHTLASTAKVIPYVLMMWVGKSNSWPAKESHMYRQPITSSFFLMVAESLVEVLALMNVMAREDASIVENTIYCATTISLDMKAKTCSCVTLLIKSYLNINRVPSPNLTFLY